MKSQIKHATVLRGLCAVMAVCASCGSPSRNLGLPGTGAGGAKNTDSAGAGGTAQAGHPSISDAGKASTGEAGSPAGGDAGANSAAGSGAISGAPETAATAGTGGSSGASGSAGSAGTAGSSGSAGSAGTAGTSGSAGSGGTGGAAPPPECTNGAARCQTGPIRRESCVNGKWTTAETCATGSVCVGAGVSCSKSDGIACTSSSECVSNVCSTFYNDADHDTYGSLVDTKRVCGSAVPAGYVTSSNDCCDTDDKAHPGQSDFFKDADKCGNFDYNCINNAEPQPAFNKVINMACNTGAMTCSTPAGYVVLPACGAFGDWYTNCGVFNTNPNGYTPMCIPGGASSIQLFCH